MGNSSSVQTLTGVETLRPHRPPISGQQGLLALDRAEKLDGYRTRVFSSQLNRKAREGQTYMPAVHSVNRLIPDPDSKEPWPSGQVIWMNSKADEGLPHTRPPYFICLPENFPEGALVKTMKHERIHVHQRMYPEIWVKLIEKSWPFKVWLNSIPGSLLQQERLNPDLLWAPRFIWKENYVPVAVYTSPTAPKLNQVNIWWYVPSHGTVLKDVSAIPEWTTFFGSQVHDGEHPYEIAAYLLSDNSITCPAKTAIQAHLNMLPAQDRI